MKQIEKWLVIPDMDEFTEKDIEEILNGTTKYGEKDAIIVLDPQSFFQVSKLFVK